MSREAGTGDGSGAPPPAPGGSASAGPGGGVGPGGPVEGSGPADAGGGTGPGEQPARRSGLRNPERAVRGLGSGVLILEAVVLLLAIQPIRVLGGELSGAAIGLIVGLAVLAVLLAGTMGRRWAWHLGTGLQVVLLAGGFLHLSLTVLGIIFGLVWAYALHVRRVILG
ncbi:DUF4233 domain-containing protein [Micromonospora cathayae]|uniref:DUF4233 domain-containing protein n=1 Tax=Micromonospora cathayae TaxID=3028804 RepID=A0ABY7ZPH4_9ACTN|nr:DUF4233 domain-containing protein [Micromonospora sp. HUAS 3]WDZ84842.1 DUF4233 domain-containing protein [Micromonospora sp. HUAS 3]